MPHNKELLIEIYSEEIPSRMQPKAMEDFKTLFIEFFCKQNIKFSAEDLKTFITPRRLVLLVNNLDEEQTCPASNKIGPKIDAPHQAIQGFLKSVKVNDISKLNTIIRDNGEYYTYQQPEFKTNTAEILEKHLNSILQKMSGTWLKSMDLVGLNKSQHWVRPIRNILAIFNSDILNIEFANLKANNKTFGHLLMDKNILQIVNFSDYIAQLAQNFVIVDWFDRRKIIVDEVNKIDKDLATKNHKLINEITGLVEYPQILIGNIDDKFLTLPQEVLQLTIKLHQKAILFQKQSSLHFVFVSNIKTDNISTQKIISDNEKVVRARLSDAKFYIDEDLKTPFKQRINLLKNIIFHKKLDSLYCKIKRIEILNKLVAIWVPKASLIEVTNLAYLAKNDLTTKTVAELPELQGIIGSYYAKAQGESKNISQAIAEQYLPTGQNSQLPQTSLGIVLAIADKIDTICAMFLVGEKPTASKDPFALRRAALGIIKILFENNISLPLKIIVDKAISNFSPRILKVVYEDKNNSEIKEIKKILSLEIINFFIERNKSYLKDQYQLGAELINQMFDNSIINNFSKTYSPFIISKKAIFVNQILNDQSNLSLITMYKRVKNIVDIEEKKDGKKYQGHYLRIGTKTKYERLLNKKVKIADRLIDKALKNYDYKQAFIALKELELSINIFFKNVEINCADSHLRISRIQVLASVRSLFNQLLK
jgi:glycyl-tRNA synthetase beta chain